MIAKMLELRDRATFIPILAIRLDPSCEGDRYLLARAGFGRSPQEQARYIVLVQVNGGGGIAQCDPYQWHDRTYAVAHGYIQKAFDELPPGAVVDVEFILGETEAPCRSEASTG